MDENKGIVGQVIIIGVILIAVAGGLLWLAVNGMLPTAAGIGSSLDPNVRTIGMIVILAVLAAVAWLILPKGRRIDR
jgi:zinc transporter ZupT